MENFPQYPQQIPTTLISMKLLLSRHETMVRDPETGEPAEVTEYDGIFTLGVLDQNGMPMSGLKGKLIRHLTDPEIAALKNFMDTLWERAQEALPGS